MRAKFINEKFTDDDSDPIHDMGIGMEQLLKKWIDSLINSKELWFVPKSTDSILDVCITRGKNEFIDYLLDTRDDYNKNQILSKCITYKRNKFIDKLLKKGAKFIHLSEKAYYIIESNGKLVSFTPEEELLVSCKIGDYERFLKCISQGTKIKIGMINSLFQDDYNYHNFNISSEKSKILQYLRDNIGNLKELIHPRDHKKLDKIKMFLGIETNINPIAYPRGYKIYRILKFIDENYVTSRKEVTIFAYELTYGKGTFNPLTNSSYWTDGFPALVSPRIRVVNNQFILNLKGQTDLKKMKAKFGSMKIKSNI